MEWHRDNSRNISDAQTASVVTDAAPREPSPDEAFTRALAISVRNVLAVPPWERAEDDLLVLATAASAWLLGMRVEAFPPYDPNARHK